MNFAIGPILDFLVLQFARARQQPAPTLDRLNIGSAYIAPSGWINIDNSPSAWLSRHRKVLYLLERANLVNVNKQRRWPPDIVFHDVRHGLPWPTQSFQFVYTSHLLEHLSRTDGETLLGECHRVLKPHGTLRVVVPDLLYYATKYVHEVTLAGCGSIEPSAARAAETFLEMVGATSGRITSTRTPHRWMYDTAQLTESLAKAGFLHITVQCPGVGTVPDLDVLDTRPVDSLHVEARRA
jgi:predicted SAM-dependent methyltransferase